ncbi:hypothetical protein L3X38_011390 [Prunus dulcis]|uniref:Uncharacterized protein n=1 Tax=Prunus dulcis TaxID=3755 RepID=A0AAD4WHQ0_PRUDU|nr:hypothetical protein L3X38_011390 [Prunus dulcis]
MTDLFREDAEAPLCLQSSTALASQTWVSKNLSRSYPSSEVRNSAVRWAWRYPSWTGRKSPSRLRARGPVRREGPTPAPRDHPLPLLPEAPVVLPYRPRRMDPNSFPPLVRGRRGRGVVNPFANNDKNRSGANWRNHLDFEEEEVLPRPFRMEHRIDHD